MNTETEQALEKIEAEQLKTTVVKVPRAEIELNFGERYAGLILDEQGQPSHHLILLPDREEKDLNWADAKKWAESVGGELPTRKEQSLLFANLKAELEALWHWSSEAHKDAYAWVQDFYDGNQFNLNVYDDTRARAVRRIGVK